MQQHVVTQQGGTEEINTLASLSIISPTGASHLKTTER